MMELELDNQAEYEEQAPQVFESAGGFAPTVGIIGAVLGLIQVMQHLDKIDEVGRGIAVAFVATIYGVGSANLLYLPIAGKMKLRIREQQIKREMTLEGVASILEGMNPRMLETKLFGFLVEANQDSAIPRRSRRVSRRRRSRPHSNHERWLVSYADFITLLFAFFVVLYASSQVDKRKVGKLSLAIQVAFQELGVFPASTTQIPLDMNDPMPFSTVQAIQNVERTAEVGRIASAPTDSLAGSSDETDLATLRSELQEALHGEIARHQVSLYRDSEGLVISLREFGFFDSGSATIKPQALPALDRIASILAIRTCRLSIEGHTDNVPIHTALMNSNWELSTARATELIRMLIVGHGFDPARLSAAGYAEYHPVASNLTAQGRAQNRRVDIVILSDHGATETVAADNKQNGKPSPALP